PRVRRRPVPWCPSAAAPPEQSRGRRAARAAQPYGRADAIADGLLIEVPIRLSRQFNFQYPLAITAAAWCDAVQWTEATERGKATGSGQNEASRLTEVLWVARLALYTNRTGTHDLDFLVHRVPVYGPDTRPLRLTLRVSVHPGDCGETVATIGHAHQPVAGTFVLADPDRPPAGQPVIGWPAADLEHDRSGRVHPVVTADILDRILAAATDLTSTSGIEVSTGKRRGDLLARPGRHHRHPAPRPQRPLLAAPPGLAVPVHPPAHHHRNHEVSAPSTAHTAPAVTGEVAFPTGPAAPRRLRAGLPPRRKQHGPGSTEDPCRQRTVRPRGETAELYIVEGLSVAELAPRLRLSHGPVTAAFNRSRQPR
ncbi:DUF6573 family protein, partial [Nakamurella sp. GG22]